ncbi:MAG: EAL domain-containing protein [Actinomyces sp.]|nr:MAG: EAL domain-containing protein [Actinomyces sp.]
MHVTATIGAAAVEEGTADDLLERAEVAADRAVESGTGTILVYDDAFREEARRFIARLHELRAAIELGSFVPHYQALVELPHGGHIGAEVLARWLDGDDIRPAGTWIDVARRGRLLAEISETVRRRALAEAARAWPRPSPGRSECRLSVNIDGDELLAEGFVERLRSELASSGLEPRFLMVEITEQALLTDLARAASVVRSLREDGIRVALDDFGTGWSSLGYLRELTWTSSSSTGASCRRPATTTVRPACSPRSSTSCTGSVSGCWPRVWRPISTRPSSWPPAATTPRASASIGPVPGSTRTELRAVRAAR